MKTLTEITEKISKNRDILAEKYGVRVIGIFGSYTRGEQKKRSDIDLLAEIEKPISLLELVGAEIYLSEVLEAKVDLVPKEDIREELREKILQETVYL
jgi:hypothetical protein